MTTRCTWAACKSPAVGTVTAAGSTYDLCRPHIAEHHEQVREAEREALGPRRYRTRAEQKTHCGTRGGFNAHWRRSEEPCQACRDAERTYQQQRYQRTTNRRTA